MATTFQKTQLLTSPQPPSVQKLLFSPDSGYYQLQKNDTNIAAFLTKYQTDVQFPPEHPYSHVNPWDRANDAILLHPSCYVYELMTLTSGINWQQLDLITSGQVRRALLERYHVHKNNTEGYPIIQTLAYEDVLNLCIQLSEKLYLPFRPHIYLDFPRYANVQIDIQAFISKAAIIEALRGGPNFPSDSESSLTDPASDSDALS